MNVVAIGGGISGRIVRYFCDNATILEGRSHLPSNKLTVNYGTNYLWKPLEGFRCKPVKVITHVDGVEATEASVKRYKNKIGKGYENREDYLEQFELESDGWEIVGYPDTVIQYGHVVTEIDISKKVLYVSTPGERKEINYDVLFSSIPLNVLMKCCGMHYSYPIDTMFKCSPIHIAVYGDYTFDSSLIYVNYLSDPTLPEYRVCQRNGKMHVESLRPFDGRETLKVYPGKIYDDPLIPKALEYLRAHDIFPIGRFGKWSSDELIHNTYDEVKDLVKGLN